MRVVESTNLDSGDQSFLKRWTSEKAQDWYANQSYSLGANYIPATASNQIEMWHQDTFDPERIDLELGWAESLGMNTMRVFLHDLVWMNDPQGFKSRINTFLSICEKHGIKPMLVFFDSVWDPNPVYGPQPEPVPGVHNSRWLQSPGAAALQNEGAYPVLKQYIQDIVGTFKDDQRILAWDLWNEPDNDNGGSYGAQGTNCELKDKNHYVLLLLQKTFDWAREVNPSQPLTSGVWQDDWSSHERLKPVHKMQLENSDIVSFHHYEAAGDFEDRINHLKIYGRPLLCTEYMARGHRGNTFENILPLAKQFNVAVYNWGFVSGRSQTHLPWDSWQNPYINGREPSVWFHDILKFDGTPYMAEEIKYFPCKAELTFALKTKPLTEVCQDNKNSPVASLC